MTGWNGNVTLAGLKLPNWIVVLTAGAAALVAWLRAQGALRAPVGLPLALGAYGLAHAGFAAIMLAGSNEADVGIGSIVTALACAGMLVVVARGQLGGQPENGSMTEA